MSNRIGGVVCVKEQSLHRLANHLVSLSNQISEPFDYTVVDYGSPESYRERLRPLVNHFGTKLIEVDRDTDPWRHGRAFNIGIKSYSDKEIVFTTGADLIFEYGFFQAAVALWEPDVVVTAPLVRLRQDGEIVMPSGDYYGTLMMVSTKRLFDINGYDEDYTHWGREDTDLVERLIKNGARKKTIEVNAWHQYHPSRVNDEAAINNTAIYYGRDKIIKRNSKGWGEM